nr:hypothetical protein [Bradyrhizobium sp. dw_78]
MSVITLRWPALPIAAVVGCILLQPSLTHAQWWSHTPKDFEECADAAEKAATKEDKTSALTQCNAKFAGRRKPSGGYTYYDFMQNRSFDIAGPNPTPEEQKHIDEQYTEFLDRQRRDNIAAAFAAKQQQQQELQQAIFKNEPARVPLPVQAPNKPLAVAANSKMLARARYCAQHTFSCQWPRLSERISDLKKMLFGSTASKAKRG